MAIPNHKVIYAENVIDVNIVEHSITNPKSEHMPIFPINFVVQLTVLYCSHETCLKQVLNM
jgi:hypothetical protein